MIISSTEAVPQRIFARSDMRTSAWLALWGTCICLAILFFSLAFTLIRPQWIDAYFPLEVSHSEDIDDTIEKELATPSPRKIQISVLPQVIPVTTSEETLIIKFPEIPAIPVVVKIDEVFVEESDLALPPIATVPTKEASENAPKKRKKNKELANNNAQDSVKSNAPASLSQLARPKHTPFPPYPREARDAKEEGTVILSISLNPQGEPVNVSIAQSSGFQSLDLAAQKWVRHNWNFYPAMSNDVATSCTMIQRLRFVLN